MARKQKDDTVRSASADRREERLAAALRANLARRKAQQRQRAETPRPEPPERRG